VITKEHNGTYGRGRDGTLDLQPAQPRRGDGQHNQNHESDKKRQSRLIDHNSVSQADGETAEIVNAFGGETGSYDA
jgi:hypothetical protein